MDWLIIEGVPPWDGRYEFDIVEQPPTYREWGWVKRFSGYMPLTIDQGMNGGDPELYAAFAAMALHRAGRIQPSEAQGIVDRLADAPFGATVRLELDDRVEDDAGPPAASSGSSTNGSGDGSQTSSENWASKRVPDGTPASATSESPPVGSPT